MDTSSQCSAELAQKPLLKALVKEGFGFHGEAAVGNTLLSAYGRICQCSSKHAPF